MATKKQYEKKIEIDGRYYRVVRTIGLMNKFKVRNMLVCDEDGDVVYNEDTTRRYFRLIIYLGYYQFNHEGIRS